ncbi:hypothetical protein HK101_004801, partial [Irineochytrium annulatum]
ASSAFGTVDELNGVGVEIAILDGAGGPYSGIVQVSVPISAGLPVNAGTTVCLMASGLGAATMSTKGCQMIGVNATWAVCSCGGPGLVTVGVMNGTLPTTTARASTMTTTTVDGAGSTLTGTDTVTSFTDSDGLTAMSSAEISLTPIWTPTATMTFTTVSVPVVLRLTSMQSDEVAAVTTPGASLGASAANTSSYTTAVSLSISPGGDATTAGLPLLDIVLIVVGVFLVLMFVGFITAAVVYHNRQRSKKLVEPEPDEGGGKGGADDDKSGLSEDNEPLRIEPMWEPLVAGVGDEKHNAVSVTQLHPAVSVEMEKGMDGGGKKGRRLVC